MVLAAALGGRGRGVVEMKRARRAVHTLLPGFTSAMCTGGGAAEMYFRLQHLLWRIET